MSLCFLATSPRLCGASDTVLALMQHVLPGSSSIQLRNYAVHPCTGCGACNTRRDYCIFDDQPGMDNAREVFNQLEEASALCVIAPVYFYGLPAHFKALVDRSQRYYEMACTHAPADWVPPPKLRKPAFAVFPAGRSQGERLFDGSRLSLRPFLWCLGFTLEGYLGLRGLDEGGPLEEREDLLAAVTEFSGRIQKTLKHKAKA